MFFQLGFITPGGSDQEDLAQSVVGEDGVDPQLDSGKILGLGIGEKKHHLSSRALEPQSAEYEVCMVYVWGQDLSVSWGQ